MWKVNLEETKKHYINWWNHKGIVLNMWEHFQEGVVPHGPYSSEEPIRLTEALRNDFGTGAFGLPGAPKAKNNHQKWFDPQWRAEYLDWYVGHSCLKADMLPVANTQLGPGSLAAILGARFEGGEDTIWIHPDPDFKDNFVFNPDSENLRIHKELLRACKERAKGNYFVGMPDLMEGLDVLAAMKGTDKVLLDTVMQPEVVEQQLKYINEVYFKVFDELYEIIREGDEMAFCYFSSWAPGKMTKLQCDISTMISEDDYRRFVQPFIREQCQKIPYTLYHLDGVGALHHLPAILEIEELNAIQWTPGVGEPQGGDPKWYDLYRKIISSGKSIMACWVTLDQLRPLLDNVGGDGIHLEMDFKNEEEVEQALRIVEEYQSAVVEKKVDEAIHISDSLSFSSAAAPRYKNIRGVKSTEEVVSEREKSVGIGVLGEGVAIPSNSLESVVKISARPSLAEISKKRILILDGGMGTMVQQYGLNGCSDELNVSRPEIISDIHRRYLAAGADIITTNTFSSQKVSLADYGWQDRVQEFNLAAARIARQAADAFTFTNQDKPRYVAGSVGPTNKCVSFGTAGCGPLSPKVLQEAYAEQIDALIEGGVDILLIETIFDLENAFYALRAVEDVMKSRGVRLPVMLSFAQVSASGINMNGQDVFAFIEKNVKDFDIFSVGVNCTSEPAVITDVVMEMAEKYEKKELTDSDFQVEYEGFTINKDTTEEQIIAHLGYPEKFEPKTDGGDGGYISSGNGFMRWNLIYPIQELSNEIGQPELRIILLSKIDIEDTEVFFLKDSYIASVWFDNIETMRGIETKDTLEEVLEAYGRPDDIQEYRANNEYIEISYKKDNIKLVFVIGPSMRIEYSFLDINMEKADRDQYEQNSNIECIE